jgi:hypothetical protein
VNFRKAYSVACVVLLCELFLQFYFAAGGIFTIAAKADPEASAATVKNAVNASEPFFGLHSLNGVFIIPLTILVLIGLSFGARYSRRTKWLTAALFGLMIIQFLLAAVGFAGVAVVAGLHGMNAVLLVGLATYLTFMNWAFRRQPAGVGQSVPSELAGAPPKT